MLDDILDALDMPRQALTNLARSAFGDSETGLLGSLPGLAGAVGTGLLGLTGVGLPLALAGGSALAGLGQGIGKASGRNEFNAPTAGEVAKGMFGSDDFLPSLLAGMVTDPLTYIGGIGGSRIGKGLGKGIEAETIARGPGYATKLEDIMPSLQKFDSEGLGTFDPVILSQAKELRKRNLLDRAMSEIPPGSEVIGMGGEGTAFKTPAGDVVRMGMVPMGSKARPIDPNILQANRTVDLLMGPKTSFRIERTPFAESVGDVPYWTGMDTPEAMLQGSSPIKTLQRDMKQRGLDFFDTHSGNVGKFQGKDMVIDPGAVEAILPYNANPGDNLFKGGFQERVIGNNDPGSLLSRLIGAQGRFRNSLDTGTNFDLQTLLSRIGSGFGTIPSLAQRSMIESNG